MKRYTPRGTEGTGNACCQARASAGVYRSAPGSPPGALLFPTTLPIRSSTLIRDSTCGSRPLPVGTGHRKQPFPRIASIRGIGSRHSFAVSHDLSPPTPEGVTRRTRRGRVPAGRRVPPIQDAPAPDARPVPGVLQGSAWSGLRFSAPPRPSRAPPGRRREGLQRRRNGHDVGQ